MTYLECLTQLAKCLEAMLKSCQEKNWAALATNEKEREQLIAKLKSLSPDDSAHTIQLLSTVIALNKKVVAVAEDNKNESEKTLLEIKRNLKKTAQYYS